MADDKIRLIRARNAQRTTFKRQGLSRKKKLEDTWRRPRGLQSKQRKGYRAKGAHPQPGYGSPKAVRGMHPSGYDDILVFNVSDLEKLNSGVHAVRIAATVGNRKRADIQAKAEELGFRILNQKETPTPSEKRVARSRSEPVEEEEVVEEAADTEEEEVAEEAESVEEEAAAATEASAEEEVKSDE